MTLLFSSLKSHGNCLRYIKKKEITHWGKKYIEEKTLVVTDGFACLVDAKIYHDVENKSKADSLEEVHKHFEWVDKMIGNIKISIHGTYHAIHKQHLPRYLGEFCFRFNHRFNLEELLPALLKASI